MKIALIGTRGVPANYGGFETCAEEIALGLISRKHNVTVYCRHGNAPGNPSEFQQVKLLYMPCLRNKVLGTFSHAFISMLHAITQSYDVIMVFNAANSLNCLLPRLFGKKIAINVDGLEWKRKKWGWFAKQYYQFAEYIATIVGHRIVSDSKVIQEYYQNRFKTSSTFIAYGAHVENITDFTILNEYGVKEKEYFFVGSRLEPENNADLTVKAFEGVMTDKMLLIAGGANYKSKFIENLMKTKDKRVKFLGPVYKPGHMKALHCGAYAYVHGNEVGGTNPALLKALGYGNCVLSYNVNYNAEVVADAAILYDKNVDDLRQKMQFIIDNPQKAEEFRKKAVRRIKDAYTWDSIVDGYEKLFINVLSGFYKKNTQSD
jgi:glycosyltransferase involved in cell wall biosynthesis